jgi:ABC-type glycerol-3-phosphate transport system substrate-binding protein
MKIVRKLVVSAVLLSLVLTSPIFAEGAREAATTQKVVTWCHIWGAGTEREQITKSIELFEAANPDVKVEEIILDAATWQPKLIQLLAGDDPPDIFLRYPGPNTTALVDQGVIAPLTEMWKEYGLDDVIPSGLKDVATYKGEVYNLPWGYHPTIVLYNKKMFDRLGLKVPTTIKEFEMVADALKKSGVYPLASGASGLWRTSYVLELLLTSLSGPEFYKDLMNMDASWADPKARVAYTYWKRWVENGYWYPDMRSRRWAEGLTILLNGESGMYFLGTYGVPMLEQAGWVLGEDFHAFLFPQENKSFPRTLIGPFDTWSKAAKAPHPKEADRLLAFLAQKDAQTMRARYHGGMACNKNVAEYDAIGEMIRDAMNAGAGFNQVIGNALPAVGVELINKGACPDFYDNPDIERFIATAEEARRRFHAEK